MKRRKKRFIICFPFGKMNRLHCHLGVIKSISETLTWNLGWNRGPEAYTTKQSWSRDGPVHHCLSPSVSSKIICQVISRDKPSLAGHGASGFSFSKHEITRKNSISWGTPELYDSQREGHKFLLLLIIILQSWKDSYTWNRSQLTLCRITARK